MNKITHSRRWLALLLLTALLLVLPRVAPAQNSFGSIAARPDSNMSVKVTGFFSDLPNSGYAPIRVEIVNKTKLPQRYSFTSSSTMNYEGGTRLDYNTSFLVASGESRVFEVMVPLVTRDDSTSIYNNTLELGMTGHGFAGVAQASQNTQFTTSSGGSGPLPHYVALSKRVSTNLLGKITSELETSHSLTFVGGSFEPAEAPSDWRAYTGVDAVIITLAEMESMAPGASAALLDWVAQGGFLYLQMPSATAFPKGLMGMPEHEVTQVVYQKGLGQIERITDSTDQDLVARSISSIIARDYASGTSAGPITTFSHISRKGYDASWALQKLVHNLSLNAPIILIFMLGFAILVGPVNLFVFAKAKHRYRLFLTTPLISLATSLLLFVVILLQDGTGGKGARTTTVYLLPGQNKMVQFQEQLSRTGLLFGQTFTLPEYVAINQVFSHNKMLSFQNADNHMWENLRYNINGKNYAGDWFRSRQRQAQVLRSVTATRGGINVIPAMDSTTAAPSIESSIGLRLKRFYLRLGSETDGTYWMAENVDPGGKVELKPVLKQDMDNFIEGTLNQTGKLNAGSYERRRNPQESFLVAEAERSSADYTFETLASVQWKTDRLYFVSFLGDNAAGGASAPTP